MGVMVLRCNVGVATVTMMSNKTNEEGKVTAISEFHWSPETIGYVDASFFWGYIVTQLPGGFLGEKCTLLTLSY
jgi:ACS family sodium-dependent inorganic phosphate cotransporter-like MFS transporter 6/7/8